MQAQESTSENSFGERLKFLRGADTQTEFADKIGVTRSALANYETGRTKAKRKVVNQIAKKLGVSEAFLLGETVAGPSELGQSIGLPDSFAKSITKDESAIIRLLRLCPEPTAQNVVSSILHALIDDKAGLSDADILMLEQDLIRLNLIAKGKGVYEKGMTQDSLELLFRKIAADMSTP